MNDVPEKYQKPTRLLDQVGDAIRLRHYSIRTEKAYVQWIKRYILFHNKRHLREMGANEVTAFLSYLATQRNVSASTQNQALNAIVFLYKYVLEMEIGDFGEFVRAKRPKRLPVVLTHDEAQSVLSQLQGREWLMANILYGAGLRVMECVRLRVKDIEFAHQRGRFGVNGCHKPQPPATKLLGFAIAYRQPTNKSVFKPLRRSRNATSKTERCEYLLEPEFRCLKSASYMSTPVFKEL